MRRFKIKNRRKRKYTKRNTKSVSLKHTPYLLIIITSLILIVLLENYTIIHAINFINSWLINQVILLLQAIEHTINYYRGELIKIISAKLILSGQQLDTLSPLVNFIFDALQRSAHDLFSNMYNILKFLYTKTRVDV